MTDHSDLKTMSRMDRRAFLGALLASAAVAAVPGLATLEPDHKAKVWETDWVSYNLSYTVEMDEATGRTKIISTWENQEEVETRETTVTLHPDHIDEFKRAVEEDRPAEERRLYVARHNFKKRKAKWGVDVALAIAT
jgi:hypothetical protein|tara:strand:- start:6493 stop:6903 length:411 start_codon:yes stop_codon:yes gene_type:complete